MKLTNNQLLLIVGGVFVVLLLLAMPCMTSKKDEFTIGREYVSGTHGQRGDSPQSEVTYECDMDELAARGADRANGYGTMYHIVGDKAYEGNNDENELYTYSNHIDDYSTWQDGSFKDFEVNPIYGKPNCEPCSLREHDLRSNAYENYNECNDCGTSKRNHSDQGRFGGRTELFRRH